MSTSPIWEWFAAAMLHDLGKTVLDTSGQWADHEELDKKPFGDLLPPSIVEKAKIHHAAVDLEAGSHSAEERALIMVDGFQQAMGQVARGPDELRQRPAFYPYYGSDETGYDQYKVQPLVARITNAAPQASSLRGLLALQKELTHYPYASYLPHLSLALHHRFTALLLYFLRRQMNGGPPPEELKFSMLTVSPEPMALFYRLRDVETHSRVVETLRKELFRRVFLADKKAALSDLAPTLNPFEFFDGGSGLVLVYDQPEKITDALQAILDEEPFLRSLQIEQTDFRLVGGWQWSQKKGGYEFWAAPDDVEVSSRTWSLMSREVMDYPSLSLEMCQMCGKPEEPLTEDITGDLLCSSCLRERQQKRGKVVDIHKVSAGGKDKVGFVFLTVKEPLREQAQEVAASLLGRFMDQRRVEPRSLKPTETGLLEYLQAVIAMGEFQSQVEEAIEEPFAYTLLRLPTKMVYLVHEDFYWRFLGFLNEERRNRKLCLPTSLRAVLCGPKTPFWSLMDGFLIYDGQDLYYDEAEGSIVMFTSDEVQSIRDLAGTAERDWSSSAQLITLSRFALTHNLAELLLEVDVRARQDKLPWRLVDPLKRALGELEVPDDENKAQTKRAKFIDYIAKMARPARGGGRKERR
ncbi:MAG: hypothetical protein H8D78_21325 [Chloroflexi bacterium]|nr:hypothetical protein [Chloroflexota bacterium]